MDTVNQYKDIAHRKLGQYDQVVEVEKKTGVDRVYLALGVAAFVSIAVTAVSGLTLIVNVFGFLYPAYYSTMAMRHPKLEQTTQWLAYWILYSLLTVTEQFFLSFLDTMPIYFYGKIAFLVWMCHPHTAGAKYLFDQVILPNVDYFVTKTDMPKTGTPQFLEVSSPTYPKTTPMPQNIPSKEAPNSPTTKVFYRKIADPTASPTETPKVL